MPEFGPQSWVCSLITHCYLFVIITRGYVFIIITCGYVFATVIYRRIFQSVMKKNKSEGCNKANIERDEMIFRDERGHLPNPEILKCSMLTIYSWLYYTLSSYLISNIPELNAIKNEVFLMLPLLFITFSFKFIRNAQKKKMPSCRICNGS